MADTEIPARAYVAWRAIAVGQDTDDPGASPEDIPLAGVRVRLTPSPRKIEVGAGGIDGTLPLKPTTYTLRDYDLTTADDGTLVNSEDLDTAVIEIVASDAIPGVTIEWTSTISAPDTGVPDITKVWLAPTGETVDLTTVASIPPSPSPLADYLQAVADARAARDITAALATQVRADHDEVQVWREDAAEAAVDAGASASAAAESATAASGSAGAAVGAQSAAEAARDTAISVSTSAYRTDEVSLVDTSASATGYMSTTSRRFIKDIIPAKAHIGNISFRTNTAAGTATIEVWEFTAATGNLTVAKSITYTNNGTAGVKTVAIDYDVVHCAYISFRNTASLIGFNAGAGFYIINVASSTLALSNLVPATNALVAATIKYTMTRSALLAAMALKGNMATVGPMGDFTTIQAAVDAVLPGETVLVHPGTYREQVSAYGKEVHIVGVDKRTCILIDSSSDYRTPPLRINLGSIRHMTIIEDAASPEAGLESVSFEGHPVKNMAYCIHADSGTSIDGSTVDQYLEIEDCVLVNANRPCVGMGMYVKHHVTIRGCEMHSGVGVVDGFHRGTLYFHNNTVANTDGQTLAVINNRIYSDDQYSVYALDTGATGGTCSVEFINNMAYSVINGKAAGSVYSQLGAGATFLLAPTSYGNNVASFNA